MEQGAKRGAIAAAGAVAIGGWVVGAVSWKAPEIEANAIDEVRDRLAAEGIDVSKVELVGNFREVEVRGLDDIDAKIVRNAEIGGVVSDVVISPEQPQLDGETSGAAQTSIPTAGAGTSGAGTAEEPIKSQAAVPAVTGEVSASGNPVVNTVFDGERLTIRGTVDSSATRQQVVDAASTVVDGSLITTEIGVDPNAKLGTGSVASLLAVIRALDSDFRSARLHFDGQKLDVSGTLRTNVVSSQYPQAIAESRRAGVLVSEDLRSPEAAGDVLPFARLNAETNEHGLVLSGSVIKIGQYDALIDAASTAFGVGNVVDQIVISPPRGAPDQSSDASVTAFADLIRAFGAGKGAGRLSLDGQNVTMSGTVETAAAKAVFDQVTVSSPSIKVSGGIAAKLDAAQADQLETALNGLASSTPLQFAFGSVAMLQTSDAVLVKVAELMKQAPGVVVTVEGHTDDQGDALFNQTLSEQRADAVRTALITKGVDAGRLIRAGFGESRPVADNATSVGRSQNRRVVFVVKRG